jgi:hypothetical protein
VSAAGVVLMISVINTMFLLLVARRDGRASQWRQVAPYLLAGFLLAIGEITLVSIARFALTGTMTGFPGL